MRQKDKRKGPITFRKTEIAGTTSTTSGEDRLVPSTPVCASLREGSNQRARFKRTDRTRIGPRPHFDLKNRTPCQNKIRDHSAIGISPHLGISCVTTVQICTEWRNFLLSHAPSWRNGNYRNLEKDPDIPEIRFFQSEGRITLVETSQGLTNLLTFTKHPLNIYCRVHFRISTEIWRLASWKRRAQTHPYDADEKSLWNRTSSEIFDENLGRLQTIASFLWSILCVYGYCG